MSREWLQKLKSNIFLIVNLSLLKNLYFHITFYSFFIDPIRYHCMKGSNSYIWQKNCISALSFSPDAQYCALATKQDHVVHLYRVNSLDNVDSWQLIQEFKELTQTVSDIDWSSDRKIVTASHDRSVVVWRQVAENRWELGGHRVQRNLRWGRRATPWPSAISTTNRTVGWSQAKATSPAPPSPPFPSTPAPTSSP